MNIVTKTSLVLAFGISCTVAGFGGWLGGKFVTEQKFDYVAQQLVEEQQTVSQTEYQIVKLAEAYEGEAKGQMDEWIWEVGAQAPLMPSAIANRIADPRSPNTLIEVLLEPLASGKGLMINALGDHIPEDLTTDRGQLALLEAAVVVAALQNGSFKPSTAAHSWATPAAADGHAYFEGLSEVASGTGHLYFADAPMRPRARPACLATNICGTDLAPKTSIRPQVRPVQPVPVEPDDEVSQLLASL